ncbi:MAG: arylsulfatase, partial [Planctomycetes bacterium]|nr:arylsulfatase [Planctomycetota bacterium]
MNRSAILVLLTGLAACSSVTRPGPTRPNIVYVLADDLGYGELGSYGQTKIHTPNLDRLAREGMRFTRHYAGAPVCAPSRCVLLTGRHLAHARIRDNKEVQPEGQQPIEAEDVTIAEVLRPAGYATAAIGKWGLGPTGSSGDPNAQGFDRFFGCVCQRVAHSYYPPHLWRDGERIVINTEPVRGHDKRADDDSIDFSAYVGATYAPDLMNAEVERFVREHANGPFFLYFAPLEPHLAMQPPREHVDEYPTDWDPEAYRGERGYLPHPRPRAGYAAMISDLDEHVGALLDLLDELGIAEDTIVMFSSDNGPTHDVGGVDTTFFASTAGLRGRKGSVFEGGLRVPMIVRWPGHVEPGTVSDHVSAFQDVMPTLAEVAGARGAETDGISFVPELLGRPQRPHGHLVWEFPGYGGQRAVIFDGWKLVQRDLRGDRPKTLLFRLTDDPGETT